MGYKVYGKGGGGADRTMVEQYLKQHPLAQRCAPQRPVMVEPCPTVCWRHGNNDGACFCDMEPSPELQRMLGHAEMVEEARRRWLEGRFEEPRSDVAANALRKLLESAKGSAVEQYLKQVQTHPLALPVEPDVSRCCADPHYYGCQPGQCRGNIVAQSQRPTLFSLNDQEDRGQQYAAGMQCMACGHRGLIRDIHVEEERMARFVIAHMHTGHPGHVEPEVEEDDYGPITSRTWRL